METWITIVGLVVTLITLGIMMRSGNKHLSETLGARIDKLDTKIDGVEQKLSNKIDGVEQKLGNKIDGVAKELSEFRLETREQLARHDERLAAIERQRPTLLTRGA